MAKESKEGSFFGIMEIGKIRNEQKDTEAKGGTTFIPLTESNIKFVHYPDCQQLIIWLTHPGREYGELRLMNSKTKKIVEKWQVTDKLNGSIQILWDTLNITPGSYFIEIDWKNGWQHSFSLKKLEEGVLPKEKKEKIPAQKIKKEESEPIEYRDGFGKPIINEDLVIRKKLQKDIARKFTRHVEYDGNLRSGKVIYVDAGTRIEFYNEMGGGNCMVYLDIPTEAQWEKETGTLLTDRDTILEFVASTVQREQASNCRYEIKSNTISFYYK